MSLSLPICKTGMMTLPAAEHSHENPGETRVVRDGATVASPPHSFPAEWPRRVSLSFPVLQFCL